MLFGFCFETRRNTIVRVHLITFDLQSCPFILLLSFHNVCSKYIWCMTCSNAEKSTNPNSKINNHPKVQTNSTLNFIQTKTY